MKKKKSNITNNIVKQPNIYNRTKSDIIIIHTDSLKLKLKEYEDSVKFKNMSLSFLGIILAVLLALVTTEFKDALSLSAYTWQAFFIFILVALVVLLIYSLINWFRKKVSIDMIIEDFKKGKK